MELTSKVIDGTLVLTVQGRLDAFGSKELEGYLETQTAEGLHCTVIDMEGVDYLSSAGLRVFLKFQQKLNRGGTFAVLANLQSYCLEVIELAGFRELLRVSKTLDEALAYCNQITEKGLGGKDS